MQNANIKVFKENMSLCRKDKSLRAAIESSRVHQFITAGSEHIFVSTAQYEDVAEIVLVNERTFASVKDIESDKVAVLNFANAFYPGGGVEEGANAQEECLCRTSTLYPCLMARYLQNQFYDVHKQNKKRMSVFGTNDMVYTPGVVTTMTDEAEPKPLAESERRVRNVITCAAPNLAGYKPKDELFEVQFRKAIHDRISRIFRLAMRSGNEVLVVGAFGCGAFGCDPEIVAQTMADITLRYKCRFKKIVWAVYDPNDGKPNYGAFKRAYEKVATQVESYKKAQAEEAAEKAKKDSDKECKDSEQE